MRILITGSSDGIGRHTAATLVRAGHEVVLHARGDRRAGEAIAAVPGAAGVVVGDLASLAQTRELARQAIKRARSTASAPTARLIGYFRNDG